jgi:hypothetical protein
VETCQILVFCVNQKSKTTQVGKEGDIHDPKDSKLAESFLSVRSNKRVACLPIKFYSCNFAAIIDVFDIDDIEKEMSNHGGGAAATGGLSDMPTIVSDDLDEPALLRKLAAQLGSDQPQSRLGASSIGLPVDLMSK